MKYISQPRHHQGHHFQNWLAIFAFRQFRAKFGFISNQRTRKHIHKLYNPINDDWKGRTQKWVTRDDITISHTICFYLRPEAPMINLSCNVHVLSPDLQLFQNWNHFIILSSFENWKFKQSFTKMIARWITWQDFLLKRKLCLQVSRRWWGVGGLFFNAEMAALSTSNVTGRITKSDLATC